jgi:hypothetical protein
MATKGVTDYWLHLLSDTGFIDDKMFESMSADCNELIAMLISSIKTSKQRYIKQDIKGYAI